MKTSSAKLQSKNHFIKEWNGTEFNLSILAKITHSNKPFIYFYWPNSHNYAKVERAWKGGIGGVKDTRISIKKKVVATAEVVILMLGKGWNPFTNLSMPILAFKTHLLNFQRKANDYQIHCNNIEKGKKDTKVLQHHCLWAMMQFSIPIG